MSTTPTPTGPSSYPAKKLEIFTEITRGPGDPPYDPSRRPKYWKDANKSELDPSQFVSYIVFHEAVDGTWSIITIWMPAGEAADTNFPDPTPANTVPPKLPAPWGTPIRPLLTDASGNVIEKLVPTPFGLMIVRTDISEAPSAWTSANDAILRDIQTRVTAIQAKLP